MYYPKLINRYVEMLPDFEDTIESNDFETFSIRLFFYDIKGEPTNKFFYDLVEQCGVKKEIISDEHIFSDFKEVLRSFKVRKISERTKNNPNNG